jgi:hypothetical protein
MLSHLRRVLPVLAILAGIGLPFVVASCDKVPLLAPTGTVINLFATANSVSLNSQVNIVATAIENGVDVGSGSGSTGTAGAGTPVQNGTLISFTTTIGTIEPAEARTHNGQVTVKLVTGAQSGTATITAYSGGASKTLQVRVGTAAAGTIQLTANPQTLGPGGGASIISATVTDEGGAPVSGVPVTFSADNGTLSPPTATTNDSGIATTTLTTSQKATVTANVAGKTAEVTVNLNPRTGITLTGPTTSVAAGVPASFTVGVGSTANIKNVTIDFGDGSKESLGALSGQTTVQHTYTTSGTFSVRATAVDASGFSETVATSITILPGQPPAVTITASNSSPTIGETVLLTATVNGATSSILKYDWNFGAGAVTPTAETTGNQVTVTYNTAGTKIITVTVTQATGPIGTGQTAIVVQAGGGGH